MLVASKVAKQEGYDDFRVITNNEQERANSVSPTCMSSRVESWVSRIDSDSDRRFTDPKAR